jgi:hypothetical protein
MADLAQRKKKPPGGEPSGFRNSNEEVVWEVPRLASERCPRRTSQCVPQGTERAYLSGYVRTEAIKRLANCVLKNTTRHVVAGSPTSAAVCHPAATVKEWHRERREFSAEAQQGRAAKEAAKKTDITFRSILLRTPSRLSPGWGFRRETKKSPATRFVLIIAWTLLGQ